jgi:hypothetical protein
VSEPKYLRPHDLDFCLAHLAEELGELTAAVGKTLRWGPDSGNPDLPFEEREPNIDWVMREFRDVEEAMFRVRSAYYNRSR